MTRERLGRLWIGLGSAALLVSGALAVVVTGAKMPAIKERVNQLELIRWCLVAHVNLATLVWFTAIPVGILHFARSGGSDGRAARASGFQAGGLGVSVLGILLMLLTLPGPGVEPVLSNYIPVVNHPQYLFGIVLYLAGLVSNCLSPQALWPVLPRPVKEFPGLAESRSGMSVGTAFLLLALLALGLAGFGMRSRFGSSPLSYFETVMWGGGHLLQHSSAVFLVVCWVLLLSGVLGKAAFSRGELVPVFAWLGLPILAVPFLLSHAPDDGTYREGFTQLMRWGIFPPIIWLGARAFAMARKHSGYAIAAVGFSGLLLMLGFVFGALIRGPDLRVPGHYHATIGAVTVAFMALAYRILSAGLPESRWIRRSVLTYGSGQTLFASGMFVAGSFGLGRKTYGAEHTLTHWGQYLGLGGMALGGLMALLGGMLFALAIFPRLKVLIVSPTRSPQRLLNLPKRRPRMKKAVLFAVAIAMATAIVVAQARAGEAKVVPSSPELLAKGKASYATNCMTCHGDKGDGMGPAGQYMNPKPRNFVKDAFKKGEKPAQVFAAISDGLPNTSMAAYKQLKEDERWALTHYVLSFRKK